MEKRTLMALALSFIVLGFYPVILQKFYPDYYKSSKKAPLMRTAPSQKSSVSQAPLPAAPLSSDSFLAENDVLWENDTFKLRLNKKNAAIRQISFPKYMDSDTQAALNFISLTETHAAVASVELLDLKKEIPPSPEVDYDLDELSANQICFHKRDQNIRIGKKIQFRQGAYDGELVLDFENLSDSPLEFRYQLFVGPTIPARHSIDGQYLEANFSSANNVTHIKESKLGKIVESQGHVDWVATKDRHFSIILKPKSEIKFTGLVEGLGHHRFSASMVSEKITLSPHGTAEHTFLLYMGPNEINELIALGLDPLVNFGKLDGIGKLLVGGLEILNKIFRNYGISIIALTILINLLLFPLTRVSYMSMKRMQLVQPQMNKLKEQHKKNPERLNKEMMELYKKHKVNPFGGCLPMILQMPVFIALYVALSKSVILINSKLLWIKDLSSPDKLPLPVVLPGIGDEIHVLPLIMVAAMFFQQKFTQIKMEGQDPAMESQQKMMATVMPVMFGFIFYSMPSGLVLYWLTNTLLMTGYQLYLKKVTLT